MQYDRRVFLGLWLMGLLNNAPYVVYLSAAEDLMPGVAGAILAADIVPTLLAKSSAPFWTHLLSYRSKVLICAALTGLSFYLTAWMEQLGWRLLGVCLTSFAAGLGELTFLSLLAFYPSAQVVAWSSGTGAAGLIGAGYYLALRAMDVAPRSILFAGGIFAIAYAGVYLFILPLPRPDTTSDTHVLLSDTSDKLTDSEPALTPSDAAENSLDINSVRTPDRIFISDFIADPDNELQDPFLLDWRSKLRVLRPLVLPYMMPMALVYFAEYTISTGVNSSLSFKGWTSKRYYVLASFLYQLGVFISRSSGNVVPINRLWPIAIAQVVTLLIFITHGWWRWADVVELWLLATVWVGLLGGALYVNAFRLIRQHVAPHLQEFCLGAASVADTSGIVVSSIVSVFIERALQGRSK